VSRERLGEHVVASEQSLRRFNSVIHPLLLKDLAAEIRNCEDRDGSSITAVDAALIPEWGIDSYFDLLVYIECPLTIRLKRLSSAGKNSSRIQRLEQFQLPEQDKRRRCHIVLDNDGTQDELQRRGTALYQACAGGVQSKGEITQCRRKLWID
jgi:dephospho-CoA kinase